MRRKRRAAKNQPPDPAAPIDAEAVFSLYQAAQHEIERARGEAREPEPDPDVIEALAEGERLARLLAADGRYEEAVAQYGRVVRSAAHLLGPDDVRTLNARSRRAALAIGSGHPNAERLQSELIADVVRSAGPDSTTALVARANLAHFLHRDGRLDEAALLFEELVSDHRRVLGPRASGTLITTANYASLLAESHRDEEAAALARDLLPLATEVLGPDHPVTRDATRLSLGR